VAFYFVYGDAMITLMYEQDMIFGPFSFKQSVVLAIGFGLSFLLHKLLPQYESLQAYIYITIAFIVAFSLYVAFGIFKNKKIPINEVKNYLDNKKLKMKPEEYSKMVKTRIALAQSQIEFRKQKGLQTDETLSFVIDILFNSLAGVDFPDIDLS
jgi:hypothetical protein